MSPNIVVAFMALFASAAALAMPINVNELSAGDLGQYRDDSNTFRLDAGDNLIAGSVFFQQANGEFNSDSDSLFFFIPQGTVLESITYRSNSFQTPNITSALTNFVLYDCSHPLVDRCRGNFFPSDGRREYLDSQAASTLGSTEIDLFPFFDNYLRSGLYGFGFGESLGLEGGDFLYARQYQFDIKLRSIPEPGTLGLFAMSILGVLLRPRRRSNPSKHLLRTERGFKS